MFQLKIRKCKEDSRYFAIYLVDENNKEKELERDTNEAHLGHRLTYWNQRSISKEIKGE